MERSREERSQGPGGGPLRARDAPPPLLATCLGGIALLGTIFSPGLSTAEKVTEISGRGVGMDVVKKNVESLRGRIGISSQPGKGTTFRITLPLTLAVTDGMLVRVGRERYIIPAANIDTIFQPRSEDLSRVLGRGEV